MENFRTFNLAVEFHQSSEQIKLPRFKKDQLSRASYSIALNLAEGRGKQTIKEQRHFFYIAMGSLRECQAILTIENMKESAEWLLLDKLGAHLYKLIQQAG
ncbi:MAG: four helix bundle protein [Bdellovibrionota bacterium]